jgi:hypothetical protein
MEKTSMIFLDFFVNFVSSCARYVNGEPIYTGYVLLHLYYITFALYALPY